MNLFFLQIGKTVSERKETIDNIVAHFNIQVDNPMCMLNQDVAKNFLNTKSTKEKYNVRLVMFREEFVNVFLFLFSKVLFESNTITKNGRRFTRKYGGSS